MENTRVAKVFVITAVFLAVGLLTIFVTHNSPKDTSDDSEPIRLVSNQEYGQTAKDWLLSAATDYSLENIQNIRQRLLDFKSPDQEVGQVHINLFLAFDAWEKYLLTQNVLYQAQANDHLTIAAQVMPDLAQDINNLQIVLADA